jgi:hypothetical protein
VPKKLDPKVAEAVMLKGGWKTLEPYKNALNPWKSECIKCGLIATPTFANVQNGSGCTKCKNAEKIDPKKLTEEQAVQIMLAAGLKPLVPYKNTKTPWDSLCLNCGKITSPQLGNVRITKVSCAYCSGFKVDADEAVKLMLSANLIPLEPFVKATEKWMCKCSKCERTVYPVYTSVKQGQGGCISCGHEATASSHRYTHEMTTEIMAKANLEPLEQYKASDTPWKCRCLKCERVVFPSFSNVQSGHAGCAFCSGNSVHPEDAERVMLQKGYEPLEPYVGHNKSKWKSRHIQCGTIVYPYYNTIQNGKGGCSVCADYGLKQEDPAYVYIMIHEELRSLKVGISNNKAKPNRIKSHAIHGWKLYKQIDVPNGAIATDIEAKTFYWIRNELGLGVHLTKELMKSGGYSETIDAEEITLLQIDRYIQEIIYELGI